MTGWWSSVLVYRDRRMAVLLLLGFSSGLPFGVLAEPLSAWLANEGVSKTEIGLFALVSMPYALKFIWAPFIDQLPFPLLARRFGRRRGWALATQLALIAALIGLGGTDPSANLAATALLAAVVALCSASQDVVIDALRVEMLEERQLAAGAATSVLGWRFGQLGASAGGLILADLLPWSTVFMVMACAVGAGIFAILIASEPARAGQQAAAVLHDRALAYLAGHGRPAGALVRAAAWVYAAAIGPLLEFFTRPAWLTIILFILLYKFGDAVLSVMKVPFFLEIGFTKTDIAGVAKLFGIAATLAGGIIGGIIVAKAGLLRGLLICGVLMAISNGVFVMQAWVGADIGMLALTVAVENATSGMGTTAFVAYLSSLCNVAYTATQYALLTSLMALSRTVMSAGAGWLADQVTWPTFFLVTIVAAIPGLMLLIWMIRTFPPERSPEPVTGDGSPRETT